MCIISTVNYYVKMGKGLISGSVQERLLHRVLLGLGG